MKTILLVFVLTISICGCDEINKFFETDKPKARVHLLEGSDIIVYNIDTITYKVNDTLTFMFSSLRSYADEQEKSWKISNDPKNDTIIKTVKYRKGVITGFR